MRENVEGEMLPPRGLPQQRGRNNKYDKYGDQSELEAEIERDAKLLYQGKRLAKIEGFSGYFEFMSNDFPAEVFYQGHIYSNVSYAYHAARAPNEKMRNIIQKSPTLNSMYDIAKTFDEPKDWAFRQLKVMESLVRDKFRRSRELREKLQATGERELVNVMTADEDNAGFWGVVGNKGQNQLGRVLEQIRKDIVDDIELEHWLFATFPLQEDKRSLPSIKLEVSKDNKPIDDVLLDGKSYYLMGALPKKCDYVMSHPSISRLHACIFNDQEAGATLLDLGSKAGTWLNGEKLKVCFPYLLKPGGQIIFGQSTRKHVVSIDYSAVKSNFEQEEKQFERELRQLEKLQDPNLDKESVKEILGLVKQDTVYVGNLEYSVSETDLREFFKNCGKIISIRIPDDYQTRRKKGYAFITFDSEAAAKQAKRHSGMLLYNRKIKVSIAEKKPEIESKVRKDAGKNEKGLDKELVRKDFESRHGHEHSHSRHSHQRKKHGSASSGSESERSEHRRHHKGGRREKSRERSRSRSKDKSSGSSSSESDDGSSDSGSSSSFSIDEGHYDAKAEEKQKGKKQEEKTEEKKKEL